MRVLNDSDFRVRYWFRILKLGAFHGDIMMGPLSSSGWDLCGLRSCVTFSPE
jgi:hypothetical protein